MYYYREYVKSHQKNNFVVQNKKIAQGVIVYALIYEAYISIHVTA